MKKMWIGIVAAAALIAAVFAIWKKTQAKYPQIVYIEDELYYGTGEKCEMVPRRMPDGVIESFVPAQIMPDMYNSANFGEKYGSMEFMFTEDGQLIVHVGTDWYYFEKAGGQ